MIKRVQGCVPCPPEKKGTHSFAAVLGLSARAPSKTLDLTHVIRRIRDQGLAGTCVGFGGSRALQTCALQGAHPNFREPSALQAYKQSRAIMNLLNDPRDGSTSVACLEGYLKGGFLYEHEMPYKTAERWGGMRLGKGQRGLRRAGVKFHRLAERPGPALEEQIKTAMCSGKGLMGGWKVGDGFEKWDPSFGPFDGTDHGQMIGHCMSPLDYPTGFPRIINSWGMLVGDRGIWTVTWEWLMKAMSLWAIDFVPES